MDEDFLRKLKSVSAKDILTDQRPATSRLRSSRARISQPHIQNEPVVIPRIEENLEEASRPIQTIAELLSKPAFKDEESPPASRTAGKSPNEMEMGSFTRKRVTTAASVSRRPLSSAVTTRIQGEVSAEYIPDLNEIQAEETAQAVASAPEIEAERITSLKELDDDLARLNTFSVVRGVDMRKLARFMLPEKKLIIYSGQDEEMRSVTYEQLYSDLLPLINGKNIIDFDFATLKSQPVSDGLSSLFSGTQNLGKKDGKKKLDSQLMQKLKDYATASLEKIGKKGTQSTGKITMATLEETLRKAKEKAERKEKGSVERKKT